MDFSLTITSSCSTCWLHHSQTFPLFYWCHVTAWGSPVLKCNHQANWPITFKFNQLEFPWHRQNASRFFAGTSQKRLLALLSFSLLKLVSQASTVAMSLHVLELQAPTSMIHCCLNLRAFLAQSSTLFYTPLKPALKAPRTMQSRCHVPVLLICFILCHTHTHGKEGRVYCSLVWRHSQSVMLGRAQPRSLKRLLTPHPPPGSRKQWVLVFCSLFPFYSVRNPSPWRGSIPPRIKMDILILGVLGFCCFEGTPWPQWLL